MSAHDGFYAELRRANIVQNALQSEQSLPEHHERSWQADAFVGNLLDKVHGVDCAWNAFYRHLIENEVTQACMIFVFDFSRRPFRLLSASIALQAPIGSRRTTLMRSIVR